MEPPDEYTIVFKTGERATYRISAATIDQIAKEFKTGFVGAYDVEAMDGSDRKLIFHFDDVLYIGPPQPHRTSPYDARAMTPG